MLPSVLHWLVPWRAVMGRDDKRRGELVGWWVALPCSPSSWSLHTFCLPLPLRLFFFNTHSYCVSRLSLLFLLRLVFHLFLLGPREMRSISKRCGERWRGRNECQRPRCGLAHHNMLQYFSISCSIFNCLSFFWVSSPRSDSVLILQSRKTTAFGFTSRSARLPDPIPCLPLFLLLPSLLHTFTHHLLLFWPPPPGERKMRSFAPTLSLLGRSSVNHHVRLFVWHYSCVKPRATNYTLPTGSSREDSWVMFTFFSRCSWMAPLMAVCWMASVPLSVQTKSSSPDDEA